MSKIKDYIIKKFNNIFRKNNFKMIADSSLIKSTLDEKSKEKTTKIRELEATSKEYKIVFEPNEKIESRIKIHSFQEKVNNYLDSIYIKNLEKTPEEIIHNLSKKEIYQKIIIEHQEIDSLIKQWQEKTKKYTERDKIKLITEHYSKKLQSFNKEGIDNALGFLNERYRNHGRSDNDIELNDESIKIFKLKKEYEQSIKKLFVYNKTDLTHITSVAPEKLAGGVLRKSIDRANNYETERVNGVFASSSPIDGNNPYIARNSFGMIKLGKSVYIYGNDNIKVNKDSNGTKQAILKNPNYIYYINPEKFNPVCNITIDPTTNNPIFEFSEEWISDSEIDISDHNQVRKIEQVKDVTSLLKHYTILCDTKNQRIGIQLRKFKDKSEALNFFEMKIKDGSIRNINQEVGINDRDLSKEER